MANRYYIEHKRMNDSSTTYRVIDMTTYKPVTMFGKICEMRDVRVAQELCDALNQIHKEGVI